MVPREVWRHLLLGELMPAGGSKRLAVIACGCLIAGTLLVGIPVETASALRFFGAGLLIGSAIFLIALKQSSWFN
jgi:hypothetical protein